MQVGKPKLELGGARDTRTERKQRRRMVFALVLLLAAMAVILVKDRELWFGSDDVATADTDTDPDDSMMTPPASRPSSIRPSSPATTSKAKKRVAAKVEVAEAAPPPSIVTNRTALPPLEIEVVAGDDRRTVKPGTNSVKVDMTVATPANAAASGPAVSAPQRVKMSADTAHVLERPVDPSYPMLARQMKEQGSVILQPLIGTDGLIQDLHVLSGPTILSSAAQEAVKQWRFKPYLQNGQPVETEAKITVNFTISTF